MWDNQSLWKDTLLFHADRGDVQTAASIYLVFREQLEVLLI